MEQLTQQVTQLSVNTNESQPSQGLQVEVSSEVSHLKYDVSHELLAMITIKAPFCENSDNQRAPLDLVAVLDISGSMSGEKIEMVRRSMGFMITQLKSDDRLAIVLFESEVTVLFDFKFMDSKNKTDVTELVNSITSKNMTDLAGGLFRGLDVLLKDQETQTQTQRQSPQSESSNNNNENNNNNNNNSANEERKAVTSILLFTDGEANVGLTKLEQIIPEMKLKREKILRATNVFCFGYGKDHVVEMLKGLSDSANGMYYYVENEENIASAFGDCIGGLLSVAAQNLQVRLKAGEGVKIKKILGSNKNSFKVKGTGSTSNDIEVNSESFEKDWGDIYSEEERNIVCLLEVSKLESSCEDSKELLVCELNGFDVLKGDTLKQRVSCSIIRNQQTKMDKEKSIRIDVHRNRLITIQALSNSRDLADKDHLDQARNVLNQAITELENSNSKEELLTKALLDDLKECLRDMENRNTYYGKGKMKMAMYETSHKSERACHSKGTYSTSKKMSEKKKYVDNTKSRTPLDQTQIDSAKTLPLAPTRIASVVRDFVVGNKYRKLEPSEFTTSQSSPTGNCEHEWTLYVQLPSSSSSSEKIEDLVEKVVVTLHPTFDPNVVELTGPTFELTKKGWGVFTVECVIHFKSTVQRDSFKLYHQLVFGQDNSFVTYHIPF